MAQPRILIVEDEADIAELLAYKLGAVVAALVALGSGPASAGRLLSVLLAATLSGMLAGWWASR